MDSNSYLGRTSYREGKIPYLSEALLEDMKYYRIHASLVCSSVSKDYSFIKGNNEILDIIRNERRLYGVATVIPDIKYELEDGLNYYENLVNSGIKAFKIYPRSLNHGFSPFYLESLALLMCEHGTPMILDVDEAEWRDTASVLQAFPELKLLLCNSDWGMNRFLFPLMERFSNLYFDLNANQANDILETCKYHFGIQRVLFGTHYPNKVMGGLKALVEFADISELEKDKIASENAMDLFNLDLKDIAPFGDNEYLLDKFAARIDIGEKLENELVIDAHAHLVDKRHFTVSYVPMINGDEDKLIKKMDRLGIDKVMICPWEGLTTDGSAANETSLTAKMAYPDRIEAYAACNPNYQEDLEKVVGVYHEQYKFAGLKPYYPFNKYDLLGEKYIEWFEYANRNKLIMLVHTAVPGVVSKCEELSGKYPDIAFLLAHSGAAYETADENMELALKKDNVFLEITYTSLTNGIIEYMVEKIGANKIIFGTDMPMRDPAPQLAWVCYAKISLEDKRRILGLNIKYLLERCWGKYV